MILPEYINSSLARLNAETNPDSFDNVLDALCIGTSFSGDPYCGDVTLYRAMLAHFGIDRFDDYSDEDLEFDMPLILTFKFVGDDGFYGGWASDMTQAKDEHRPFGYDHYRYYFLVTNPADKLDPLVQVIDHENVRNAPSPYRDLTASKLLAILRTQ